MTLTEFPHSQLFKRILQLFVVVNIFLLLYYVLVDYQFYFHADAAVKNLLAQEIFETGSYFPRDWRYVNGDLWVLFGHTFIVPLLAFHVNSFALHALSGLITTVLILLGTWLVTGIAGQSVTTRLWTLMVMASGISVLMAENVYGQAAYGAMYYLTCFLVYCAWRFLQADTSADARRRWLWGSAFVLLVVLAFWGNPQRAAAYYALPLIAAVVFLFALDRFVAKQTRLPTVQLGLLGGLVVGALTGTLLYRMVMADMHNMIGIGAPVWLGFDGMVTNFLGTLRGILTVMGGLPDAGAPIATLVGVYQATRFLLCLIFLGLAPWALARALHSEHRGRAFLAAFTAVALLIVLFIQVATSVPDMHAPDMVARYLTPALLFLLVMFITVIGEEKMSWLPRTLGFVLIVTFASSSLFAFNVPHSLGRFSVGGPAKQNPTARLAAFLISQNLHYGYAGFWSSGALTVMSGGQVKVRQVTWSGRLPVPMRQLASDRWYLPTAWTGESFILTKDSEFNEIDWPLVESYAGRAVRSLIFEGWHIVVFKDNLASTLPFWDLRLTTPLRLPIYANSLHNTGRFEGGSMVAAPGETGVLHFGPFMTLEAGRYVATFDIDVTAAAVHDDMGLVDVTAASGSMTLASQKISHVGRQTIALPFGLSAMTGALEMRLQTNGAAQIRLHGITVTAIPAP